MTAGEAFAVVGKAHSGNIRSLQISKNGYSLDVDRKTGWSILSFFRNDLFEVTVTMPSIEGVKASSGGSVSVDAAGADGFEALASSGATLSVENLGGGHIELGASSGASMKASGDCGDLNATASSGASLSTRNLECKTAEFSASSGASLSVSVSEAIAGSASSGASVSVSGGPEQRNVQTSSGASVSG